MYEPADFRRAFERKRSAADNRRVVHSVENGRDYPHLGISLGRKRIRSAAAWNIVERAIREAFRLSKTELPPGLDLVVVPRGPGLTAAEARRTLPGLAQAIARRIGLKAAKARTLP